MAALEHLRTAHHEEVSEILRLKTAMTEVRKLLDQPLLDDEEIDESYDGPGPQEVNPEDLGVAMEAENESVMTPSFATCMGNKIRTDPLFCPKSPDFG